MDETHFWTHIMRLAAYLAEQRASLYGESYAGWDRTLAEVQGVCIAEALNSLRNLEPARVGRFVRHEARPS